MRRVICGFLTVLMLVSMLAVGAVSASAASSFTTSERAIKILKEMEGFAQYAYKDNSQYSIGYGCSCNPADYPNGITEGEADTLLRERLVSMEAAVNKFADRYSLSLSQQQFDSLMLFTYNCGSGWTTTDSDFRTSIINGDTGNDLIYYMTRWCTASGEVSLGLVNRRLAEADLYLYGYYNVKAPSNYAYVLFNANGGTCESRIQGYDASEPVAVRVAPVYTGYRFLGWYTAADGGKWITDLDSTTMNITLYAHWQKDEGDVDANGAIQGDKVSYQRKAGQMDLTVYETPSSDGEVLKTLEKNSTISIVADYIDSEGAKWGKLSEGGWVILNDTTVDTVAAAKPQRPASEDEDGITVMVTGNNVNIRSGAGTDNAKVGTASYGQTLVITEVKVVGDMKWGKFSGGWICLTYTNYDAILEKEQASNAEVIATGKVKNCGGLRIRAGAGASYEIVGTLPEGTAVQLNQIKTVGGVDWGRIASGWICLNYVTLDSEVTDTEDDTKQEESTGSDTSDTGTQITGTVISNTSLNVRKGPGTSYGVVGSYPRGTKVTILEQKTVGSVTWGRTDKGWISLNYVKLDSAASDTGSNSGANTDTDNNSGTDSSVVMTGTVVCSSYLNVRDSAGMGGKVLTALAKGTVVKILETKVVGTTTWGRIDKGWISLSYVKLDSGSADTGSNANNSNTDNNTNTGSDTGTNGSAIATGTVVNANSLRIRSGAGTGYSVVGGLTMGQRVSIYEVKTVSGIAWGRIDKGWISMSYVQLDPGSNVVIMTGTVTVNGLRVRSAAGTQNAIVGYYDKGAKVEIYETSIVGGQTWGRTDEGWICLSYVA